MGRGPVIAVETQAFGDGQKSALTKSDQHSLGGDMEHVNDIARHLYPVDLFK